MPHRLKKSYPVFAPFEVVLHNQPDDCWISFLGKVLNITPLIQQHKNEECIKPLLAFAGKDISHWFDKRTGEIQHYVHPITGTEVPYCPHGPLPDVNYQVPTTLWRPLQDIPWWKNEKYQIGILTKCVRPLKIINMLIAKEVVINVCCEDTFERIQERFSIFNKEADSFTWRTLDKIIDMKKTMEENDLLDDRDKLAELGISRTAYIPCVFIYYNDNLKHYDELDDD